MINRSNNSLLSDLEIIDWERFFRIAKNNKVLLPILKKLFKVLQQESSFVPPHLSDLYQKEKRKLDMLVNTLKEIKVILAEEPYLISKTYRGFSCATHDVDVLVKEPRKIAKRFTDNGFKKIHSFRDGSCNLVKEGLLEVELYSNPIPGQLVFIDDELAWSNPRLGLIEGVEIPIPSAEADALTFLADINFRLYEIWFGDLLYLFNLLQQTNMKCMVHQAQKYHWQQQLFDTICVINSFHHKFYGESRMDKGNFSYSKEVYLQLQYLPPFSTIAGALVLKGPVGIIRLYSYCMLRLGRKYTKLYNVYLRIAHPIGKLFYSLVK